MRYFHLNIEGMHFDNKLWIILGDNTKSGAYGMYFFFLTIEYGIRGCLEPLMLNFRICRDSCLKKLISEVSVKHFTMICYSRYWFFISPSRVIFNSRWDFKTFYGSKKR